MRQFLTIADFIAEIKMTRAAFKGTLLLVEGPNDAALLEELVDPSLCRVIPDRGKESVLAAMATLQKEGLAGLVALVDADFWHLGIGGGCGRDVVCTDVHDLELLMVRSAALDTVLREMGSSDKISQFFSAGENRGVGVRSILLTAALPVGLARFVNARDGLGLSFEAVPVENYVRRGDVTCDDVGVHRRILQANEYPMTLEEFRVQLAAVPVKRGQEWQVCQGHDVLAVLAVALRKAWGSRTAQQCTPTHLGEVLRMAFRERHFRKTQVFRDLVEWEAANPNYRIF